MRNLFYYLVRSDNSLIRAVTKSRRIIADYGLKKIVDEKKLLISENENFFQDSKNAAQL